MDSRTFGAIVLGVAAAAITLWYVRRRPAPELFVEPRPEWTTPPHGDPLAEGRL
jgi:hypothetical protein